jgi:hypothetical protein
MIVASLLSMLLMATASFSEGAVALKEPSSYQERFEAVDAGFAIQTPEESWGLTTQPGPYGISALTMGPKGAAGKIQLSIQVSLATTSDMAGLVELRDSLLEQIKAVPGIRGARTFSFELGDLSLAGLRVAQESGGIVYAVRQLYVVSQGLQYKIQYHAPKSDFGQLEPLFEEALKSFVVRPLSQRALEDGRVASLAARCGSEVPRFDDWDLVVKRAKAEGKLILVTIDAVSGFDVGDQMGRGPFMNPDVVRLIDHYFLVLRWRKGMGAPFENPEVFGLSSSTFGTGMLVVTPQGEVLKQIYALRGTAVYDVLLETVGEQPDLRRPDAASAASRQETIELLLHSGQLEEAEARLTETPVSVDPVAEAVLNSELGRLQRNAPEALMKLDEVLALPIEDQRISEVSRHQLLLLKARLLMLSGVADEAEDALQFLISTESDIHGEYQAEALLLKGALRYQAEDQVEAERLFKRLINEYADSRWAWHAAGILLGPAWKLNIYPNLSWAPASQRRLISLPELAANGSRGIDSAHMIESAADYLLASQQAGGSWITLTAYGADPEVDDDFDLAATAIGGRALLRLEGRPEARAAAERALEWMHGRRAKLELMAKPPVVFMDYAVWSRSYAVFFLADCLESGLGDEENNRRLLDGYVEDLVQRQQENGGWSYYLSGSIGGAAVPQSISFTTATVVLALERAAELGFTLADGVLSRGLDCLEAMRSPQQTFGYFLRGKDAKRGERTGAGIEGAAARGPVCSLALLRGEREAEEAVQVPLQLYVQNLSGFGEQRRKALMHAGAHTQGSHYLLYDYSTAAEALAELGRDGLSSKLRKKVHATIMFELRACRNQDGSYLDNPLIGADVGTGLALNCLLDLAESSR